MNDQLLVKNSEGKDQVINVIDIVLDNETERKYIYYSLPDSEEVYVGVLVENNDKYLIQALADEFEFSIAEEILNNKIKLEGGADE